VKAICRLVGDHDGAVSTDLLKVTLLSFLPLLSQIKISELFSSSVELKASFLPSGEKLDAQLVPSPWTSMCVPSKGLRINRLALFLI